MAFIKKNWLYLLLGLVAIGSIATAAWAYMAGDAVLEQLKAIDGLRAEVQGAAGSPQNRATIEAKKIEQAELIAAQEATLKSALTPQNFNAFEGRERQLLVPDAIPNPPSNTTRFEFKTAYKNAFAELARRLKARGRATADEIAREDAIDQAKNRSVDPDQDRGPWMPPAPKSNDSEKPAETGKNAALQDVLKTYPQARAAEFVARQIYMYLEPRAFASHAMLESEQAPSTTEIWHAQMTLWIQQDIALALSRVNERRAARLREEGRAHDMWVAHMPVKHLEMMATEEWLGRGGGTNMARFAKSFTGVSNDAQKFIVPIQLLMVVEEASIMEVVDSICRVGFYTPTRIQYEPVALSPLQDEYIYGEAPVIRVRLDIEGVYFRTVFDKWIPKDLAPILSRPGAVEDMNRR